MLVPTDTPAPFRAREAFRQRNLRILPVAGFVLQGRTAGGPIPPQVSWTTNLLPLEFQSMQVCSVSVGREAW